MIQRSFNPKTIEEYYLHPLTYSKEFVNTINCYKKNSLLRSCEKLDSKTLSQVSFGERILKSLAPKKYFSTLNPLNKFFDELFLHLVPLLILKTHSIFIILIQIWMGMKEERRVKEFELAHIMTISTIASLRVRHGYGRMIHISLLCLYRWNRKESKALCLRIPLSDTGIRCARDKETQLRITPWRRLMGGNKRGVYLYTVH